MDDSQLLRYSRQIMLPQLDIEGQKRLSQSRALILGLGGLGSPVAMYLASAGVGHLFLSDYDEVDLSNLQRQIIHKTSDVGRKKTESARDTLHQLNPEIEITLLNSKLDQDELCKYATEVDIILDCTDNFQSRFRANRASVKTKTPLISGATIRYEGQISVFQPALEDSPCYNCLYDESASEEDNTCVNNGVLSPLPGIIGSLQALEALKVLLNIGCSLTGKLLIFDGLSMEWRTLKLKRNFFCGTCGTNNTDNQS